MMRDTTKKKAGAGIAALVLIGFLTLFIVALIVAVAAEGELAAMAVIGIYVLIIAAVIVGIGIALGQRIREINSGEEDDAKQY